MVSVINYTTHFQRNSISTVLATLVIYSSLVNKNAAFGLYKQHTKHARKHNNFTKLAEVGEIFSLVGGKQALYKP